MFNLWPKNEVKEIIDNIPKFAWKVNPTIYIDEKEYTVRELVDYVKNLLQDNKDLKKILENIEEDGTYEHNNAIKLREENAELRSKFDEFVKEILGLRHLKEENVQLMERINKLIEDGTRVCVENASLKESNVQLMERVNEIDSDMNKEYQAEIFILKNEIAMLKAKYQILEHNYQGCTKYRDEYKHQLNAANKEIKKLKEDIIDYVIEKEEEQKHPMYPIHWGGLDPDILKQAQEQSIEEVVESLKGVETQGFEDYDSRDFVELSYDQSVKIAEMNAVQEDKEFSSEELLKRVTEYADSLPILFPKDLFNEAKGLVEGVEVDLEAPLTDLPRTFPNEFQDVKTTAENLEEKFDKGEDVLDYFEKPWQCPCNMCKHAREESQDKSWEEAASDLALRVVKLEKQIEELKINRNLTNQ
jgi:hypothetical protein